MPTTTRCRQRLRARNRHPDSLSAWQKRNQDHHWHKRRVVLTPTKMTVIVHQEEDHNDDRLSRQILRKGMLLKKNGEKKKDCKPEHYGRRFFVIDGSGTVSYYRDEHGYRKQHAPASSFSCIGLQIVEDAGRLEDGSVCFNLRVASSTPGAEAKVKRSSCVHMVRAPIRTRGARAHTCVCILLGHRVRVRGHCGACIVGGGLSRSLAGLHEDRGNGAEQG